MPQNFLGRVLLEHRKARELTQDDVASALGISRQRYGQIENGKEQVAFDPERAQKLARLLQIDMLQLCVAMGFPIRCPGFENDFEPVLLQAFRSASPAVQEHIRRGLGLET